MGETTVNREYKDRLFKIIFGRQDHKEWTLSLYNALHGTNYDNVEDVEINTLEDAVFMGMKNDVSYIFNDTMNIYEQQSSICPNMPIRGLMYAGRLYDKYIKLHGLNIYGRRQVSLPVPKLVVFFNGPDDTEDEKELLLSDAFSNETKGSSDISVRVRMLNINQGHNKALLEACKVLNEYSWFVSEVRKNAGAMGIEDAVDLAINEMPSESELKAFLEGNRAEVKMSCLTEYDEEATMRAFREEAMEEGMEAGMKAGMEEGQDLHLIEQICKKIAKGKNISTIADEVEEDEQTVDELVKVIMTFEAGNLDIKEIYMKWKGLK